MIDYLIYNSRNFTGDLDATGAAALVASTTVEILQATLTYSQANHSVIYNSRNFTGDLDATYSRRCGASTTVEILQATLTIGMRSNRVNLQQ